MSNRVLLPLILSIGLASPNGASAIQGAPDNVALQWNDELLQAVGGQRAAPMVAARALAIVHTCMFDAWAAFDARADGVHWMGSLRQPESSRTADARAEAVSFAAHMALSDLFPARASAFDERLNRLGYRSPGAAGAVGQTACASVLADRHHDGANQLGDLSPGAYSDYTGYLPVNTVDAIVDPNRWQPLATPTGPQRYLTPHWGRVLPFAIDPPALRPPAPPAYPHGLYTKEANQVLHFSRTLDDRTKMIAEYWADGPATVTPPGHWALFAQWVSRRDGHTLDDDVVLFFALGNALLDASVAVWDCKREYDFVRPVTAIRFLYGGTPIRAWGGPGAGTVLIDGNDFRSYIATPPFADYVSGHSAFSAAGAEILRLFSGNDGFGASAAFTPGSSTIEPGVTPANTVTLTWRTFSEAADEAGLSRRYGGIHFESADLVARTLGRGVGGIVWQKVHEYLGGTATTEW